MTSEDPCRQCGEYFDWEDACWIEEDTVICPDCFLDLKKKE